MSLDTTIKTFHHPRYEIIATGDVHDGEGEAADFLRRPAGRLDPERQGNELARPLPPRG